MQVHQKTGRPPFNLLLTSLPSSITLPGESDQPGIPASDERVTSVKYKRVDVERLHYATEKVGHKQAASQRRCEENIDKKVQTRIEVQLCDQVFIDRPRVECSAQKVGIWICSRDIATT